MMESVPEDPLVPVWTLIVYMQSSANAATEILAMRRVTWKRMSRRAIVGDIYFWLECEMNVLVSGIEKISGKVSRFKSFSNLPKSQKYTGLASYVATPYGVIKRANEIVEELME